MDPSVLSDVIRLENSNNGMVNKIVKGPFLWPTYSIHYEKVWVYQDSTKNFTRRGSLMFSNAGVGYIARVRDVLYVRNFNTV